MIDRLEKPKLSNDLIKHGSLYSIRLEINFTRIERTILKICTILFWPFFSEKKTWNRTKHFHKFRLFFSSGIFPIACFMCCETEINNTYIFLSRIHHFQLCPSILCWCSLPFVFNMKSWRTSVRLFLNILLNDFTKILRDSFQNQR